MECVKSFQRFLSDERKNTFTCQIAILRGSEIVNRQVDKCKSATGGGEGENSQVKVLEFLSLVQIRNEKLRRLIGLFCKS